MDLDGNAMTIKGLTDAGSIIASIDYDSDDDDDILDIDDDWHIFNLDPTMTVLMTIIAGLKGASRINTNSGKQFGIVSSIFYGVGNA